MTLKNRKLKKKMMKKRNKVYSKKSHKKIIILKKLKIKLDNSKKHSNKNFKKYKQKINQVFFYLFKYFQF